MLEKPEKRKTMLDKKDDQLNKNLEMPLKDQEVAEKMLQRATKTLTNVIDQEDMMAMKAAKEIVSVATANLAVVNSGVREHQKLCSQLSLTRKNAFEKMFETVKQKKSVVNNFDECLQKETVKIQ